MNLVFYGQYINIDGDSKQVENNIHDKPQFFTILMINTVKKIGRGIMNISSLIFLYLIKRPICLT